MKAKLILFMVLMLMHGVLWTSCSGCLDSFSGEYTTVKVDSASGVVYDHFIALPDRGWDKEDSAIFELPLFERDADLDVTITVRHTNRYPYQNLQLVAFLAELDTSNIINSLPIRQNDDRIDSLIHRQDSLQQEKAQTEQKLAERKALHDSLGIANSDTTHKNTKSDTSSKDSLAESTLKVSSDKESAPDSLKSLEKKATKEKEKDESSEPKSSEDSLKDKESKKQGKGKGDKKNPSKPTSSNKHTDQSGKKETQSDSLTHVIEFSLFNSEDEKNGSGMMFVETDVSCGTIHLKANTRYKIFITHNMKEGRLKGISDIGIELKGCKKQPIDKMNTKWWDKQKKEN